MRFAITNGQRAEAQPLGSGECPCCRMPVVARCGELRVWHWAHKGRRNCDPWWENETEWHRAWKGKFPADWQEVVHVADDGERHIADVKTWGGWALEFQHSAIAPEERRSRESYYGSMIWIVDGLRRQRDAQQFYAAWSSGERERDPFSMKRRIASPAGALLRDWADSRTHVFFDFGDVKRLWWLFPGADNHRACVQDISREVFVRTHTERTTHGPTDFDARVDNFRAFIASFEAPPITPMPHRRTAEGSEAIRIQMPRRGNRL